MATMFHSFAAASSTQDCNGAGAIARCWPDTIRSIAGKLPKGVAVVDAPVRGSVSVATEGRLEIFVGASDADFERVRPILESLGSVARVGGFGVLAEGRGIVERCQGELADGCRIHPGRLRRFTQGGGSGIRGLRSKPESG